jgi:putative PEP-CTERM system histidine kinase
MNLSATILLAVASGAWAALLAIGTAFLGRRAPDRWMFCAGMLIFAAERLGCTYAASANSLDVALTWENRRILALAFLPGPWLLFSLTYARGGVRAFLRQWRWPLAGFFALPVAGLGAIAARGQGTFVHLFHTDAGYIIRLGAWGIAVHLLLLAAVIAVLMNLERTLRASVGTVRWRIKFMLLGTGVLFVVRFFTTSQALLYHGIYDLADPLDSGALILGGLLMVRSLVRTGHFELEVHPSRSILQGSITILLAGVYLLAVGALAKLVVALGGAGSFPLQALVILVLLVLLALLLQSDRLRLRLRRFVSRHFQRPIHDYRTVWHTFTEKTAARIAPDEYCHAVVKLLSEIFQTLSVSLWLVNEQSGTLTPAASTSATDLRTGRFAPGPAETGAILRFLQTQAEPVDFEETTTDWAAALRRCHTNVFEKSGPRICVPVVSGGERLAMILLGDRVGGLPFTLQDFDLLKSIADHVASGLLNARLSQRLLEAREHEAFQTMAAFFVHDLKNAAHTLNLMLQNLPAHFDDPAFREDALRSVAKSVAHINAMISRLGELRHELKIRPAECDLNQLVADVAAGFESAGGFHIQRELEPLPLVRIDRDQFAKVVTNLLLNGREAMQNEGELQVHTARAGAWAVLVVRDYGCGMTPEFVAKSLFRPFQTTKKNGLGIGMFQSRMIVEAHGGRITVESQSGAGTTFRVFLPLPTADR